MRIIYLHQHFSTPSGATSTRSYAMAQQLRARGHQVTMVCGSYGMGRTGLSGEPIDGLRRGMVDGVEVVEICLPYSNYDSFPERSLTFLRYALKSTLIALSTPCDLIFATSTPLTAGLPGIAMRLLRPRCRFVFEVRDLWPDLPRAMGVITNPLALGGMSVLEWVSYNLAHGCVALSPGIEDGIRKRCVTNKSVAMIPNGCDLELFRPDPALQPEADDPLPGKGGLRAVFTGAHGIANGLDAVLDAAAELKARGREDIHLIFIGDGMKKPGLQQRAAREGLTNCHFLDSVPKRELARLLARVDVGLMILDNVPEFYYGTSPNKFFDYIAVGLPVLNNYPGWLADMIQTSGCGKVVPPGDAGAFADALEALAEDPKERRAMGRRGQQMAEREFSRDLLGARFVDFLEQQARPGHRGKDPR